MSAGQCLLVLGPAERQEDFVLVVQMRVSLASVAIAGEFFADLLKRFPATGKRQVFENLRAVPQRPFECNFESEFAGDSPPVPVPPWAIAMSSATSGESG